MTDRGTILFHETISTLCSRVFCLEDPYGAVAAELLRQLRDEAMERGYHVISCPCPLSPEKLDHLLIPERGLGFITITPQPDTLLRVFMAWKPLTKAVEIAPQTLTAPERTGFTAVEWGGAKVQ